jgi:type IV pilus assembly protein PilW
MNKIFSKHNAIKKPHLRLNLQSGMTLIEIMIAMLLGAFLVAGVMQIFLGSRQSYRLSEGQSRLQENARFALELLSHDLRLAGFIGCSTVSTTNPVIIANNPLVAPLPHAGIPSVVSASTITGGNNNTGSFTSPNPALSSSPLTTDVIQGTDAITVQFGESCGGYTTAAKNDVSDPTGIIPANHTCGTITSGTGTTYSTIGTPLVIADCGTAHVFRASAGTSQNKDSAGTVTSALGKSYAAGSEIMLFRSYTYFIRNGAGGQPALWRFDNNKPASGSVNPEELIEGIENMQITYGIDTDADGSANQYKAAPTAAEIQTAVSARIVLTARSIEDNILSTPNASRTYNGAALIDRRLLKNFTATIDLRNR